MKKIPQQEVIERLGIDIVNTTRTGHSHYKITVEYQGERRFFIAATTNRDHRGIKNFEADVRRWMKGVLA